MFRSFFISGTSKTCNFYFPGCTRELLTSIKEPTFHFKLNTFLMQSDNLTTYLPDFHFQEGENALIYQCTARNEAWELCRESPFRQVTT